MCIRDSSYSWTYDAANRLTDEVLDHWDDSFDQTESFTYDLTGNRTSLERDKGNDGTIDEAITYSYDANDRLLEEVLDDLVEDTNDTTTTYGYDHTQQTSKTVTSSSTLETRSSQLFSYDVQGRMASVTNEGYDETGTLTSRERTNYQYDSTGYRIELTNQTDADLDGNFTTTSRTEFLSSRSNFTGYAQTLRETTFDADGNVTKTIDYTFGADEISQRVVERDDQGYVTSDETHLFGHDGHGSVRVLYDLTGSIEQIFTFSSYGVMVALHNAAGQSIAVTDRLSSLGYSGEHFDAKAGQQYLRARFYNPANGRFNRLDPFAGNNQDPQSLHKYAYVHGDPIGNVDPSGLRSLGSVATAMTTIGRIAAQHFPTVVRFAGGAGGFVRALGINTLRSFIYPTGIGSIASGAGVTWVGSVATTSISATLAHAGKTLALRAIIGGSLAYAFQNRTDKALRSAITELKKLGSESYPVLDGASMLGAPGQTLRQAINEVAATIESGLDEYTSYSRLALATLTAQGGSAITVATKAEFVVFLYESLDLVQRLVNESVASAYANIPHVAGKNEFANSVGGAPNGRDTVQLDLYESYMTTHFINGTLNLDLDVRRLRLVMMNLSSGGYTAAGSDYRSLLCGLTRFGSVTYNGREYC